MVIEGATAATHLAAKRPGAMIQIPERSTPIAASHRAVLRLAAAISGATPPT
jgi:hypothetical protein